MADDKKAVGPLATAKLVALIKAALDGKLDKTGGTIFGDLKVKTNAEGTGNIDVEGEIRAKSGTAHLKDVHATGTVHSDLMAEAPLLNLRAPLAEKSVQVTQDGDTAVKMECFDGTLSKGYARLEIGTPTGDNDAATKAYVDGRTHDYYDVTVTSSADAAQTIDGGIIDVRGSADKTVAEIAAAYAAGAIVRCIYNGNIMRLMRATDGSYTFAGVGANYGVARSGNITITIMSTSNGDTTLITSAAGELPIPDSDVSQNGCVLVVRDGQWMYSADKLIPATPTSNGLMSAADKVKLDSMDSVCYDIYAQIGAADTHDSVYKYACTVSRTFAEIDAAVHAGKTPRVLLVDDIDNPSDTRIICPLSEYDTSRSEGGYYFDAPGLVGVNGSGRIYIDENGAMYTCSAGELPAVGANQDGKYLMIDGGRWTYKRPDAATATASGFMSTADKAKLDSIERGANKTVVDAALDAGSANPVQNKAVKAALDGKAGTAVATTSANGLMSKDDKDKLNGVEAGANKTIVDDAMSDTSTNPVQNKAVKAALDGKLSTLGGEISGHLDVGQTVSAEGSVSVGRTSSDTGIHFEKAASDAGRISHGSDPMTGVAPIARLKVASPTEDDDAATKAYVDGSAVRYDAAQTLDEAQQAQARENVGAASAFAPILTSPVMIRKERATDSAGVYLSTIDTGEKRAEIRLEDVNENAPVAIANLRTPTGAGKDDYAATKGYVDSKVASGSGVTVDTAMSGTSTNPVQNKVIKQYVDGKVAAAGSNITVDATLSSTSTNPVQNKAVKAAIDAKADKTALDAKADKTALNAKMDKFGGTFTGNVHGKYFCGTWLQSTEASDLGRTPGKIAVLDDSGWVYYRTPAELFADLGIANAIKSYVDTAIVAAINSAY